MHDYINSSPLLVATLRVVVQMANWYCNIAKMYPVDNAFHPLHCGFPSTPLGCGNAMKTREQGAHFLT